jgi:hypothetical protein
MPGWACRVGVLLVSNSAGATLRVRHDGDDTRSVLNLERVTTGLLRKERSSA